MKRTFGRHRGLRVDDPGTPRGYLRRLRDLYRPLKEWVDAVLFPKRYAGGQGADWPGPEAPTRRSCTGPGRRAGAPYSAHVYVRRRLGPKGQPFQGQRLFRPAMTCEVATCSPFLYRFRCGGGFLGPRGVLR